VVANKPVIKKVANDIEAFLKNLQGLLTAQLAQEQRVSWQSLFSLLKQVAQADPQLDAIDVNNNVNNNISNNISNEQNFTSLTTFWQKRLCEQVAMTYDANIESRNVKTLTIEILAQAESPKEYAQQRMTVQVALMQEQMLSGAEINLTSQLVDWLQLGKLTQQDLVMLERLEKIFVS
ncbi:MAG: DUF349 domain-containing protein, partial [Colwellia sp.]|nr:DUF349 domain-containing protein [Colwellia sp.]